MLSIDYIGHLLFQCFGSLTFPAFKLKDKICKGEMFIRSKVRNVVEG